MTIYSLRPRHVRYLMNLASDWHVFSHDLTNSHSFETAKKLLELYDKILHGLDSRVSIIQGLDDVCRVCSDKKADCGNIEAEEKELIEALGFSVNNNYSIGELIHRRDLNGA
ncbi:MAG: hypothetical protein KJ955_06575 [Nanoarchaeota archaeon]|nr:hypothetical protein [Nanoarchaeota archaeon]